MPFFEKSSCVRLSFDCLVPWQQPVLGWCHYSSHFTLCSSAPYGGGRLMTSSHMIRCPSWAQWMPDVWTYCKRLHGVWCGLELAAKCRRQVCSHHILGPLYWKESFSLEKLRVMSQTDSHNINLIIAQEDIGLWVIAMGIRHAIDPFMSCRVSSWMTTSLISREISIFDMVRAQDSQYHTRFGRHVCWPSCPRKSVVRASFPVTSRI